MSEGFKGATSGDTAEAKEVKIPIVGYKGHRVGYKAQNFYGKNFRDCAI
jgi:hypothetical protein